MKILRQKGPNLAFPHALNPFILVNPHLQVSGECENQIAEEIEVSFKLQDENPSLQLTKTHKENYVSQLVQSTLSIFFFLMIENREF